jgi:hypothetical protein
MGVYISEWRCHLLHSRTEVIHGRLVSVVIVLMTPEVASAERQFARVRAVLLGDDLAVESDDGTESIEVLLLALPSFAFPNGGYPWATGISRHRVDDSRGSNDMVILALIALMDLCFRTDRHMGYAAIHISPLL